MAVESLVAQTTMRSVVPLAFVVAAIAEAADEWRVFGPEVAHNIAASRAWVDDHSCLAPVLVASYLAVELVLRLLWEAFLGPAVESPREAIVPRKSRRLATLGLAAPVARPALENS